MKQSLVEAYLTIILVQLTTTQTTFRSQHSDHNIQITTFRHNQIYEYLIKSNLLTNSQHGFRPHHSKVTALLDITNR